MIGRGSRICGDKKNFQVVDLGNNIARFGPWSQPVDWHHIFKNPDYYLENIVDDHTLESEFIYEMPESTRLRFTKSKDLSYDIKGAYKQAIKSGKKSFSVIEDSIEQHAKICIENSEDVYDAREHVKHLQEEIAHRVNQYCYCIMNSTNNYKDWLFDEYNRRLRLSFNGKF